MSSTASSSCRCRASSRAAIAASGELNVRCAWARPDVRRERPGQARDRGQHQAINPHPLFCPIMAIPFGSSCHRHASPELPPPDLLPPLFWAKALLPPRSRFGLTWVFAPLRLFRPRSDSRLDWLALFVLRQSARRLRLLVVAGAHRGLAARAGRLCPRRGRGGTGLLHLSGGLLAARRLRVVAERAGAALACCTCPVASLPPADWRVVAERAGAALALARTWPVSFLPPADWRVVAAVVLRAPLLARPEALPVDRPAPVLVVRDAV